METVKKFDSRRVYAVRCPSCKRFMNVAGDSLNGGQLIKCRNCGARSRAENWVKGSNLICPVGQGPYGYKIPNNINK